MYVLRITSALVRKVGTLQNGVREIDMTEGNQTPMASDQTSAKMSVNEQFISTRHSPPPPIGAALRVAMRMGLYRFYAFVGRRKLGWGFRRRASAVLRKLFGLK